MTMGPTGTRTLIALLMIAGLSQSATATSYTVGGTTGWTLGISASFYDDWAAPLNFVVGDTLDFPYVGATHNVFAVSAADLASCNYANAITTYDTLGGATVPLTIAGTHYYICGIPGHCTGNMKVTIVVSAAAPAPASAPSSAPTPATNSPTPAPAPLAPVPLVAATPGPAVEAPGPSVGVPKGGASSLSGGSAMIVGAALCGVASLLV